MKLKDVLETKGRRVVTVSAKSSVADAIRGMHAEKVGAVMVPDAEGCPVGTPCGPFPYVRFRTDADAV